MPIGKIVAGSKKEEPGMPGLDPPKIGEDLKIGDNVQIIGLEKQVQMNGKRGVLMMWNEDRHRWQVRIPFHKPPVMMIKPENLIHDLDATEGKFPERLKAEPLKEPRSKPSKAAIDAHNVGMHAPPADWCEICIGSRDGVYAFVPCGHSLQRAAPTDDRCEGLPKRT